MELEETKQHIKTLAAQDWNKLFDLIPQIEQKTEYGEFDQSPLPNGSQNLFHPWQAATIVDETQSVINELNLVPVYNNIMCQENQ